MQSNTRSQSAEGREQPPRDPVAVYLERLGPGSRRTMREALSKIARIVSNGACDAHSLPWHTLDFEQTTRLRERLAADLAPATANKHLAALRGVLRHCCELGSMTEADYRLVIALPSVRGPSPRPARRLDDAELRALMRACEADPSPAGDRDTALLSLLLRAGLRRSEVVTLDIGDFDRSRSTLALATTASRKGRRIILDATMRVALEHWLARRGPWPGPLFNPVNKGGRLERRRLSEQAIYIACHKRSAEADVAPVSPEDLRRSQATATHTGPDPGAEHFGDERHRSAATRR